MHLPALERGTCMKRKTLFHFHKISCINLISNEVYRWKAKLYFIKIKFHAFTISQTRNIHEKSIFLFFHKFSCIYPLSSEVYAWKAKLYFIFIKFHAFTRSRTRYMHEKSIFSIFSLIFMHLHALERCICMNSKSLFHLHKNSCIYPLSN